uniref:C2H2-type domain-containing protein n=1 Tax=Sus scrofa TaxID=9823 RepID=A0A8D1TB20_PIG
DPRVKAVQYLQQPEGLAFFYIPKIKSAPARKEEQPLKKRIKRTQTLNLSSVVLKGSVSLPPRHSLAVFTPLATPGMSPESSSQSRSPTRWESDKQQRDQKVSMSDESWTTFSALTSDVMISQKCIDIGHPKSFICPRPGCKKDYKNLEGIRKHTKKSHAGQVRGKKKFRCTCRRSYETAQGLRRHELDNFHIPKSSHKIRKMCQQ